MYLNGSSIVGALLDVRNKLSTFETEEESNTAITQLRRIQEVYNPLNNPVTLPNTEDESTRDYFARILNPQRSSNRMQGGDEIEQYLTLPPVNQDTLEWWKLHGIQFKSLSTIAKDYLAIPVTSVPCEQAFSVAQHTISKIRNRLKPETARASLCLKSWLENEIIVMN